jgi:hypothetical protein
MSSFFLFKSVFEAFLTLKFGFVIFWQKEIVEKAAHKMLAKLTTLGANFINILRAAFALEDPERAKIQ